MATQRISVEESLVVEAMRSLGVDDRSEAIRLALQQVVRRARLGEVVGNAASVGLDIDRRALEEFRRKG